MKIKWRKWNRVIHRDLGYFFFAMTVIYALSGIAVNHINDWNPNYQITYYDLQIDLSNYDDDWTKEEVLEVLDKFGEKDRYKKHYIHRSGTLKVFLKNGNMFINLASGKGELETISRRPILHAVNYLHYNPGKWWTWFSDVFAGALILLAITGLFIVRGKNGLKWRGTVVVILGIVLPVLYLILFY